MFIENLKIALRNFVTSKLRTMLSLLGIMIGVSSVIIITTLGNSATSKIQREISSEGMDIVMVEGGWGSMRSYQVFSPELGEKIKNSIPSIVDSTPVLNERADVKSRWKEHSYDINCVTPSYANIFDIRMAAGRFLSSEESENRYPGVVLGYRIAQQLFPAGGAVGSSLKLLFWQKTFQMTIVGVLSKKDEIMGNNFNDSIFMDLNFYKTRIEGLEFVSTFYLKVHDPREAVKATKDVKSYLKKKISEKDAFWVDSLSSISKMYKEVTGILNIVLGGIAAISLLVGGIGIMNIMLVSVTERTREIGIRKALGAPARVIRGQFLTESAALTAAGGILGVLVGSGIGKLITHILEWPFSPVLKAYGLAIVFSAVIGLFFGIYPAVRASKLDPIQALSYE